MSGEKRVEGFGECGSVGITKTCCGFTMRLFCVVVPGTKVLVPASVSLPEESTLPFFKSNNSFREEERIPLGPSARGPCGLCVSSSAPGSFQPGPSGFPTD